MVRKNSKADRAPKYDLTITLASLIYNLRKSGETCGENHARLAMPPGWSAPFGSDRGASQEPIGVTLAEIAEIAESAT
jgi:hypothetical protein